MKDLVIPPSAASAPPDGSADIGIKDNYLRGSVGEFLRKRIPPGAFLSFVSAYFSIYAYDALKDELEAARGMRFLFGEPRFLRALDPARSETKHFMIDSEGLALANVLSQKAVARDCARWVREKVQVRTLQHINLLHGKMYLVAGPEGGQGTLFEEDLPLQTAVLGSSNFTVRGLGLGTGGNNIELNLIARAPEDFAALQAWFDAIWNDTSLVRDATAEVERYLSQLYENQSPEFVYYKTLYHVFERFRREEERGGFADETKRIDQTAIWKALFPFQKDGVKGILDKINRHGGCILADSVGLGKTFEALAVIKYFEMKNAHVLVLCPKKLRENWTVYQASSGSALNPLRDDRFSYTVLSHTDLSRESGRVGDVDLATFHWDAYDLVVIDESHNFRTESHGRDGKRKTRYQRLMEDIIRAGGRTKVLLLSATPVNNDLKDLRAQVRLLTGGDDAAFAEQGIANLSGVLNTAQKQFNQWAEERRAHPDGEVGTKKLLESLSSAFFTLLDEVTIARSRSHVQRYYADSLDQVGNFPRREKPVSLFPAVDTAGEFPPYDQINRGIADYRLALFRPTAYLKPEFAAQYAEDEKVQNFSQVQRENYLVGMMKVNFLKRLESSVHSFATTLERTVTRIEALEAKIGAFAASESRMPSATFTADDVLDRGAAEGTDDPAEGEEEESEALTLTVGALTIPLHHLDLERWRADLEGDRRSLRKLAESARAVTPERDAKLAELKALLRDKAKKPNRKVLVFTAFADTAAYLYDTLHAWAKEELGLESALVVGSGSNRTTFGSGATDFMTLLTHFSPRSKRRASVPSLAHTPGEIDLLIATDCISEGQNLQDCDTVVNYDIHWNPVRLIQRFGRVDRLGSVNPSVTMVNFWPTADLDQYVNLKSRVEARMALVDVTATGYDGLLQPHQIEEVVEGDLHYRDRQLLALRDTVLDLEEMSDAVTLSDFTLDDFRMDLLRFLNGREGQLENAPPGLYAVVPAARAADIPPGVIFCLRQKDFVAGKQSESVNPTAPYFLVYMREDGVVRFNFTGARQILDRFRHLCLGRAQPWHDLCDAFDAETNDGRDMTRYSALLTQAVAAIQTAFQKRDLAGLFAGGRGAKVTKASERVRSAEDFELITWLVIRHEDPAAG
jgi:Superfamily II DNA/RNA helicases, SNF2 family